MCSRKKEMTIQLQRQRNMLWMLEEDLREAEVFAVNNMQREVDLTVWKLEKQWKHIKAVNILPMKDEAILSESPYFKKVESIRIIISMISKMERLTKGSANPGENVRRAAIQNPMLPERRQEERTSCNELIMEPRAEDKVIVPEREVSRKDKLLQEIKKGLNKEPGKPQDKEERVMTEEKVSRKDKLGSHSLDERLLLCSDSITVKQVRFHPGSVNNNHVIVLTSENFIRFYKIENAQAINLAVYQLGVKPIARFPGGKIDMLAVLGETAVDFDFGQPEIEEEYAETESGQGRKKKDKDGLEIFLYNVRTQTEDDKIIPKYLTDICKRENDVKDWTNLVWPIYVLRGNGSIYSLSVSLTKKCHPKLKGPLPIRTRDADIYPDACSIICLKTNPEIICCGLTNGLVNHILVLPIDYEEGVPQRVVEEGESSVVLMDVPNKELFIYETMELELGLSAPPETEKKKKSEKLYLYSDESNSTRYFITHDTGIHCVNLPAVNELQNFISDNKDDRPIEDIFSQSSKAEYMVCTQSSPTAKGNPVIGFSPYYNPPSVISMLADGSVMSIAMLSQSLLRTTTLGEDSLKAESPLKKMMNEPFDQYIQKILKFTNQPILKLSTNTNSTQKDCYELLQRTAQIFREKYFPNQIKAQEEIEKRVKSLKMLKQYQMKELDKMRGEKQVLQEKAENLAEKYEDIKDKQDELMKRCEKLLILVSQKKSEPSDAEKEYLEELKKAKSQIEGFHQSTDNLKLKVTYQRVKMENWKSQELKKHSYLNDMQENTIRSNLENMAKKISDIHKQVIEFKKNLNIK